MALKVVVPYVNLHPLALKGLQEHAPDADLVDLGPGSDRYYLYLCGLWREGESFLIVEQDIEIHGDVLPQLEQCPEPWCIFPYPGPRPARGWSQNPDNDPNAHLLYRSLGCTRFSSELMGKFPGFMNGLPCHDWRRLDAVIHPRLEAQRFKAHIHWPQVLQHHVWENKCCCEQEHDSYPVDNQGRYVA